MPESLNMMLLSNDYSKIYAAAMLSMVASSFGTEVNVFVSMEALPGFHKDPAIASAISKGPTAKTIAESNPDGYLGLFRQAKELGGVTLYACGLVMDINKWTLSDLEDVFDDTMGIAGFLGKVQGQPAYTF